MKEDASFPRAQQKSQRGLLLAQPESHAHHEPITVLGGVRVLIGQVADDVNFNKLHRLRMEEGLVSPGELGVLLPEEKVDAGWAKIRRCPPLRGERVTLYRTAPIQFQLTLGTSNNFFLVS